MGTRVFQGGIICLRLKLVYSRAKVCSTGHTT